MKAEHPPLENDSKKSRKFEAFRHMHLASFSILTGMIFMALGTAALQLTHRGHILTIYFLTTDHKTCSGGGLGSALPIKNTNQSVAAQSCTTSFYSHCS